MPCNPIGGSQGSTAGARDSDEVTSSELDALSQVLCASGLMHCRCSCCAGATHMRLQLCSAFPSVPFEIIAPVYMRLGHDEDATTQANRA